jgi:hypothetical protein
MKQKAKKKIKKRRLRRSRSVLRRKRRSRSFALREYPLCQRRFCKKIVFFVSKEAFVSKVVV